ncbi:MAG: T9SS type A sorting domain-containing protein, partial [Bacteroidia bacterium]|nr:T9SS type A sorting domain-containing protein [Bacteroidia bacterium]
WVNIVWGTGNWSTPTMNHQQGSTYSTSHIPAYKYQCNSCSPAYSFSRVHEKCGEVYLAGGWYGTWVTAQNQFIEIFETNAIGSHTVTGPYYANWFPATSPSVYLRKLNSLYTFVPGKIYKIKLAVSSSCTGWHESSNWIRYSGAVSSSGCGGGGGSSPHRVSSWQDKIEVYPNPTTGTLSIFLGNVPQKAISVVLADVTGKVVATTTLQEVYTQWHVDVPQGMYILQIPELNYFEKIIVQQ